MPLPRFRTLLLLLSLLTLLLLLCYLSLDSLNPLSSRRQATSSFLFSASAVISLANDNSTFFISRPAAFGPALPKDGMEGELFVLEEGQLACDDTPGWDPSSSSASTTGKVTAAGLAVEDDDGTDDVLNPLSVSSTGATEKIPSSTVPEGHADIESIQQAAEIEGKIVLVQRGGCGFLEKVLWTQRRGGVALIVGDYKRSGLGGGSGVLVTMYAKGDTSNVTIPSLFTTHTTAQLLTTLLPKPSTTSPQPSVRPQSPVASGTGNLWPFGSESASPMASQSFEESRRPPQSGELFPAFRATRSHALLPHDKREGLWIMLTPASMSSSPFFDTLLVLVVSPLVTLTIVYALLLIRSRIRRRRWRAPKSVVDRLPVRTYHTTTTPPSYSIPTRSSSLPGAAGGRPRGVSSPPRSTSAPSTEKAVQRALAVQGSSIEGRGAPVMPGERRYLSGSLECVVCLEEYVDGISRVMKLPCGHEFHVGCITPWLTTRRRTCPICKGDVVRGCAATHSSPDAASTSMTAARGADETTPLVLDEAEESDSDGDLEAATHERRRQ